MKHKKQSNSGSLKNDKIHFSDLSADEKETLLLFCSLPDEERRKIIELMLSFETEE